MAEHQLEWLSAYLDGELVGKRLEQVEAHLSYCMQCQAELAALRRLSQVVRSASTLDDFPLADRFTAQLMLRLPRKMEQPTRHRVREAGWWLVPAVILGSWVFVQTIFLLSGWIWTAEQAGLLGEAAAYLSPEGTGTPLLTSAFQWLGLFEGELEQQVAQIGESIGWSTLIQILLQGVLDLLYIGWLVAWWTHRHRRETEGPTAPQRIST